MAGPRKGSTLEVKEAYEMSVDTAGKSSEINRQLALAGIAIIWVFKQDKAGRQSIPFDLFLPGLLIIISLALDLLQHVVKSELVRHFAKKAEKSGQTVVFPSWQGKVVDGVYWTKLICTTAAYILLGIYLADHLFNAGDAYITAPATQLDGH
jgi:hypothetical protein